VLNADDVLARDPDTIHVPCESASLGIRAQHLSILACSLFDTSKKKSSQTLLTLPQGEALCFGCRRDSSLPEGLVFSIGDFSKITGLTVKTLRYYHEQGLLVPTQVDEQTGYRYYDRSKIEIARIIVYLRSLDLSIDEVREILCGAVEDADLRAVLERQKARLESKISRDREIVRSIHAFLTQEEETERIMAQASFQIEEKMVEPVRIAGIRMKGRYSDCGTAFARIGRRFGRYIRGKPILLHYDNEYREDDADFEACMPIRGGNTMDGITTRELTGGRCVSLLHLGPYDQLGKSYAKVLEHVRDNGYEIVLPTREVYLKGPGMIFRGNSQKYLTEIQMLIKE
jgi:DNA-binding transcriptional MerR regulator